MRFVDLFQRSLLAAAIATAGVAQAQDIKLGFNGDLSASPSAQSGKAGVIGIQAAIDDINAPNDWTNKRRFPCATSSKIARPPRRMRRLSAKCPR